MSASEVTEYIESQPEPMRSTLQAMRKDIMSIEPQLEQVIAWKSAMFKFQGKYVAGLCAHKAHISYSPQSAEVMESLSEELADFVVSKSSFQVEKDKPLSKELLTKLVRARLSELG